MKNKKSLSALVSLSLLVSFFQGTVGFAQRPEQAALPSSFECKGQPIGRERTACIRGVRERLDGMLGNYLSGSESLSAQGACATRSSTNTGTGAGEAIDGDDFTYVDCMRARLLRAMEARRSAPDVVLINTQDGKQDKGE
jgi:hypothetical protein